MRSHLLILSLITALGLGSTGCIKKFMVDGQIQGFRQAATSADSLADYDMARPATEAGLAQFEGLHALSPDNADALYLLAKSWTAYGTAFVEDEMQVAQDAGNDDLAEYHRKRARMAYDRAIFYGLQLIGQKDGGFQKAKGNVETLDAWLKKNFTSKDDAPNLIWAGTPWLLRAALMLSDDEQGPALVAELYVGVSIVQRAVELDPSAEHYQGPLILASYHARSNLGEMDEAKRMFDDLTVKTQGKNLFVPLYYALRYACSKGDAALYTANLNKVLAANDPDPDQRLENAIAKRQAKRWLGKRRAMDVCSIDVGGSSSSDAAPPPPAPPPPAAAAPDPAPEPAPAPAPAPPPPPAKPAKPTHTHKPTAMAKPKADASR